MAQPSLTRNLPLLEPAYAAVVLQTLLFNPVVHQAGSLQIYLNTLTWPLLAAGALVRWARGGDARLNRSFAAVVAPTMVVLWLVVFEAGFGRPGPYAAGNALRLAYLPLGILPALAVYRSSERLLDVAVVAAAIKGSLVLSALARGPVDLANRLTVIDLGGHNIFGAFLVILVLLRASTWALAGRRPNWLVLGSLCVCVVCILLTFSRAAFLALVVGLGALSMQALLGQGRHRRSFGAAFLLAFAIFPFLVTGPVKERLTTLGTDVTSGRTDIWRHAWSGFADRPLNGNGFGSFEIYSPSVVDLTRPLEVGGNTYSAHSVPLQILYEWGAVGLALAAWAAWLVARRCWSPVIVPVVAGASVVGLFETPQYVVQVSWVLGLVLAVGLRYRRTEAVAPAVPAASMSMPRPAASSVTHARNSEEKRSDENDRAWSLHAVGSGGDSRT